MRLFSLLLRRFEKKVLLASAALLFVLCTSISAQQPGKISRIVFLTAASLPSLAARIEAFRQGLRELGYVEGQNIIIEFRHAEGKLERVPALAAELVGLKLDVIVTPRPAATRPARETTATIPIVMAFDNDPVGNGFIASLARPGGNITGLSSLAPDISRKQLELLKEIVPKFSRVAVLTNSTTPGTAQAIREMEVAAPAIGIKLRYLDVQGPEDIETVFRSVSKERADAVLVLTSFVFNPYRREIAEFARKHRIPAIYSTPEFVEDGGLMTYSVSLTDLYRRAAVFVDKILKRTRPADLPVEQPMKFEFIINLKTAKQIGVVIPPNVLVRADA